MSAKSITRYGRAAARIAPLLALALGACSDSLPSLPKFSDLNPFAEKQVPLTGKRIAVMQEQTSIGSELAPADRPIVLPSPRANDTWSQPGGDPNNVPGHLALGATLKTIWSADAGAGSSKSGKLTASPIVYDGKVFTLDAAGKVSAFAASGGSLVWKMSTVPATEKDHEGYGGGLAADGGRLYAATGYGTVVALDPKTGKQLWEKNVGVPVRSSPTAAGERLFLTTIEGQVYALNGADGTELWTFRGIADRAGLVGNASPAIEGDVVIVPYPSGDVVALKTSTGQAMWNESLARTRVTSSLAAMSDAARPVIDGGTVFAVGHAGRMIATSARTGDRQWSLSIPGTQAPQVAGDTVFVVDTQGQLIALTKRDGKTLWSTKLQGGPLWSGPVLAGGKLWLVSSKGLLISVDATTGKPSGTLDLGQPVFIAPVVAGNRMFVLTDKARLIALN